jgi:hypothetical protein
MLQFPPVEPRNELAGLNRFTFRYQPDFHPSGCLETHFRIRYFDIARDAHRFFVSRLRVGQKPERRDPDYQCKHKHHEYSDSVSH